MLCLSGMKIDLDMCLNQGWEGLKWNKFKGIVVL